ncbi:phage tail family protein [Bacillus sp. IITD106]|nr:phage tail family protein [Bacillus sp. IITD106]
MYGFVDAVAGSGTGSTSMSIQTIFNGINLDESLTDSNGSFITLTVSGRSVIKHRINTIPVPGRDGLIEDGYTMDAREITVKYKIADKTNEGFRKRYDRLNALLVGQRKILEFTDEDAIFYATMLENDVPEEDSNELVGRITFLCSDPYKYGPERTANWPSQQTSIANFVGKVSGSTVENPHLMKYIFNTNGDLSVLQPPPYFTQESQVYYNVVDKLDGKLFDAIQRTQNGHRAQVPFSFNLIAHVERKYNITLTGTTAEKVAWLKANVKKLTCNWFGRGSGPSGNRATLAVWRTDTSAWLDGRSTTNSSITRVAYSSSDFSANPITSMNALVDSNGFVHFLAHAEASNGTIASRIETDYVDLEVEALLPQLPLVINNEGTAPTFPTIEVKLKKDTPFVSVGNGEDDINMIGQIPDADEPVYEKFQNILTDTLQSTVGWTKVNFTPFTGAITDGTIIGDTQGFVPSNYGYVSGMEWHGPALTKSLGQTLQDFYLHLTAFQRATDPASVGRVEAYALDNTNKPVCSVHFVKDFYGKITRPEIILYDANGVPKKILSFKGNQVQDWTDLYGYISIIREGQRFIAQAERSRGLFGGVIDRRVELFHDVQNKYQRPIVSVSIAFQAYRTNPTLNRNRAARLSVDKINQQQGVPYIGKAGDIITFNHVDDIILKNGIDVKGEKAFIGDYFELKSGQNVLIAEPSDAIESMNVRWPEKFR